MTKKRSSAKTTPVAQMTRGEKVCAFIERYLLVPEGDLVGKPFRLEAFQRKFVLDVYDNPHRTRRAYLSIARKNGKTALIAALLLAHIVGPESRRNTNIVSGAMSRDQAALVFELASKMLRMSPQLTEITRIVPSGKKIIGIPMGVTYQALSAEAKTQHGRSPALAILDEIGQVRGPRSEFVEAITSSQGAYEDALLIAISTQAPNDGDMLSIWLDSQKSSPDPRIVSHVYQATKDCGLDDREAWKAANPGLGAFKSIADLEMESRLAIEMPSSEPAFRNLHLNQRVETSAPFVTQAIWDLNNGAPESLKGKRVYGGLDLSSVHDLSALVLVSEDGDVEPTFWLPRIGLLEKARRDHVPYDVWHKDGLLQTTPGKAIDYRFIAEHLRTVFDEYDVQAIAFDRFLMEHLMARLREVGFSERELEKFRPFGQGYASMTPALRELEVRLLNSKLRHGGHPVLRMCAANVRVDGQSGARKFVKGRDTARIDGMVALAMAVGVLPAQKTERKYQAMFV